MNKKQLKKSIAKQHDLKQCNLDAFSKEQLEDLVESGEMIVTVKQLRRIFKERNTKAAKNSELALKNSRLASEVSKLEKQLEEYKKGQDLYGIIQKPLVEMSDEELQALGLVTAEKFNNLIDIANSKINFYRNEYNKTVELLEKSY